MIVAGAVLQLKYTGLFDILWDARLATPVLLLALGFICTLLGFLGCCGAIRENYWFGSSCQALVQMVFSLTLSFAVLLALLLFVEIVVAIFAYAMHDTVESGLVHQLTQVHFMIAQFAELSASLRNIRKQKEHNGIR